MTCGKGEMGHVASGMVCIWALLVLPIKLLHVETVTHTDQPAHVKTLWIGVNEMVSLQHQAGGPNSLFTLHGGVQHQWRSPCNLGEAHACLKRSIR